LLGWQALDYVRQRYGLPNSDYDRQRHQQQFIKAMAQQVLSKNVITNPGKLDNVLKAAGSALIFDGKGHSVVDWGFALKNIRSQSMSLIKLPGGSVYEGNSYQGEALQPSATEFFASVTRDAVGDFIFQHPEYLQKAA
jgi:anionic cell wall polymer biosynthesis LytR-Cps2A-Psr (LCP) family protein